MWNRLYTPQPGKDVGSENSDARASGDARKSLFCSRFSMRKAVAPDHDCDEACDFGDGPSEESLQCGKSGVEGRLSVSCKREQERHCKQICNADRVRPFGRRKEQRARGHKGTTPWIVSKFANTHSIAYE